jgi:uncharacterized protein YdeI (YjbR/CyaY-like superfamily)
LSFLSNGIKRVIWNVNGSDKIHSAIQRVKKGEYYLVLGKRTLEKLKLKNGMEVIIVIAEDKTEYQFDIPEEFMEVFETDELAHKIFHTLTDGNKRGLISLVNMVKSTDKKIERSLKIAEKLKIGIKSPQKVLK